MEKIDENNYQLNIDDLDVVSGGTGVFAGLTADELYHVLLRVCQASGISSAFQTAMDKFGATESMIASCENNESDCDKLRMLASSLIRNPRS